MLVLFSIQPVFILYAIIALIIILAVIFSYIIANKVFYNIIIHNGANRSSIIKIGQTKRVDMVKNDLKKRRLKNDGNFFIRAKNVETIALDGIKLNAKYYDNNSNITVVCVPGFGAEPKKAFGLYQYVYRDLGYNILSIEARSTGDSNAGFCSFGYFEHTDLMRWINYLVTEHGKDIKIIIAGVSLGAHTSLLVANKVPSQVIGIIADSGFISPIAELDYLLFKKLKLILPIRFMALRFLNHLTKSKFNFAIDKFDTRDAVSKAKCPICFIHSSNDSVSATKFSRKNYEKCSSYKELYILPNSDHLLTCYIDEENYANIVTNFVNKCQTM